jgi:hypothetical protein
MRLSCSWNCRRWKNRPRWPTRAVPTSVLSSTAAFAPFLPLRTGSIPVIPALTRAVDERTHREVRHGGKISGRSSQESRWDNLCAFRSSVLDARCSSATVTNARQPVAFARPRRKVVACGHSRWSISRRWYHPPPCSPASSEAHRVAASLRTGCLRLAHRPSGVGPKPTASNSGRLGVVRCQFMPAC